MYLDIPIAVVDSSEKRKKKKKEEQEEKLAFDFSSPATLKLDFDASH